MEEEIDKMIAEAAIKHGSSAETTKHNDLIGFTTKIEKVEMNKKTYDKTHNLSLVKDKVLLTLFYDPLDKNSADFYDDTFVSEKEVVTGISSANLEEVVSISSKDMKPWNKLKLILNTLQDNIPYAHREFLYLEEIKCSAKKMEECHLKDSILVKREAKSDSYRTDTLGRQTLAEPPPRGENLVEKLPKVILSFLKPNGVDINNKEKRKHHEIEYEGLYTMYHEKNPININNMLKYIKDTTDRHLEILDIDLETENKPEVFLKMIHHTKMHHPQVITNPADLETINTQFSPLNTQKIVNPPFYNNSFIYKCRHCPMFRKPQ